MNLISFCGDVLHKAILPEPIHEPARGVSHILLECLFHTCVLLLEWLAST